MADRLVEVGMGLREIRTGRKAIVELFQGYMNYHTGIRFDDDYDKIIWLNDSLLKSEFEIIDDELNAGDPDGELFKNLQLSREENVKSMDVKRLDEVALLFAEKHGIIDYKVNGSKMNYKETFNGEGTYDCELDLNTMEETRKLRKVN